MKNKHHPGARPASEKGRWPSVLYSVLAGRRGRAAPSPYSAGAWRPRTPNRAPAVRTRAAAPAVLPRGPLLFHGPPCRVPRPPSPGAACRGKPPSGPRRLTGPGASGRVRRGVRGRVGGDSMSNHVTHGPCTPRPETGRARGRRSTAIRRVPRPDSASGGGPPEASGGELLATCQVHQPDVRQGQAARRGSIPGKSGAASSWPAVRGVVVVGRPSGPRRAPFRRVLRVVNVRPLYAVS